MVQKWPDTVGSLGSVAGTQEEVGWPQIARRNRGSPLQNRIY